MTIEIIAQPRGAQGTGASRRLRRTGRTPGIVYGGGSEPVAIDLDHNNLFHALRKEAFHSSILDLVLGETRQPVLLRDVQMHPWKQLVLHVDFQRVDPNQEIHMNVPLHYINEDIAPGVKTSGGAVSHIMNEVEVLCLPSKLPEFIEVDLINLAAGHSVHLSEIKLPEGVRLASLVRGEDLAIAAITVAKGAAE